MKICYNYKNILHFLEKIPYETDEEAYSRLFYIIHNKLDLNNIAHINKSKIYRNQLIHIKYN
jgi:hypothetical protein